MRELVGWGGHNSTQPAPDPPAVVQPSSHPHPTQTVFEVAASLPNYGVGHRVSRTAWRGGDCFWTLTRVKPAATARGRGDAWGVLTWKGDALPGEGRVTGGLKKVWRCADGGGAAPWAAGKKAAA